MSVGKIKQRPLRLGEEDKRGVRTQFGALCWRKHRDEVQVLLITSRRSKRWILPKGWPMHNQTPADAAATEAWEEAGVRGQAVDNCLGVYSYVKPLRKSQAPVLVMVYPLAVTEIAGTWPEQHQRKRKWYSVRKAAKRLTEPGLRRIVATFDPSKLPG